MLLIKTWHRYFFSKILKSFLLVLLSFFLIYVLIDYSMHLDAMMHMQDVSISNLALYYGMLFSKRWDLLAPLALLIASIKILVSLSQHNELLALQTSGVPLRRLTAPFFIVGLFCVALSYANFQLVIPKSLQHVETFKEEHFKAKAGQKKWSESIQGFILEDGSHLLYQKYDSKKRALFDCFWILSMDELYHIKTLEITAQNPIGSFVDHMIRNEEGKIEKVASYPSKTFDHFTLNEKIPDRSKVSVENLSIQSLIKIALRQMPLPQATRATIQAHLYFKLLMPWLSILVLMSTIPFCVLCTRSLPIFLIFSTSLFSYMTLFTLTNGGLILAEGDVLSPFWALFTCPLSFCAIFTVRVVNRCLKMK